MNFNIAALRLIVPLVLVCLIGGKGDAIAEIVQDDIDEMTKDVEEMATVGDVDVDVDVDGTDKNTQSLMMDKYIEECESFYKGRPYAVKLCRKNEELRLHAISQQQTGDPSIYTNLNHKLAVANQEVLEELTAYFMDPSIPLVQEKWAEGSSFTNHWKAPTMMKSLDYAPYFENYIDDLNERVMIMAWDAAQKWVGNDIEIEPVSMYGIRSYTRNQIVPMHVDQNPLLLTVVLCVAQKMDESKKWPLYLTRNPYDENRYEIMLDLSPGDMVMYEGHVLDHGRRKPLEGNFFANIYFHFQPIDHKQIDRSSTKKNFAELYNEAYKKRPHSNSGTNTMKIPSYVVEDSLEEKRWLGIQSDEKPRTNQLKKEKQGSAAGSTNAHHLANIGNIDELIKLVEENAEIIHKIDENGWIP